MRAQAQTMGLRSVAWASMSLLCILTSLYVSTRLVAHLMLSGGTQRAQQGQGQLFSPCGGDEDRPARSKIPQAVLDSVGPSAASAASGGLDWDRLRYYLGDQAGVGREGIGHGKGMSRKVLGELLAREPGFDKPFVYTHGDTQWKAGGTPNYYNDMSRICNALALPKGSSFAVQFGDAQVSDGVEGAVLVKSRTIVRGGGDGKGEGEGGGVGQGSPHRQEAAVGGSRTIDWRKGERNHGILLPLNTPRHWLGIAMTNASFVPWEDKREELVWRGTTTGGGLRRDFVWALADEGHDVKFNKVTQGQEKWVVQPPRQEGGMATDGVESSSNKRYQGKGMTRKEVMGFKYVLSLEGNDVATNTKWLMTHNSVMVMPTPTKESWLMEGLLQPYVHYVPLNDPADAGAVLDWMRSHDEECQQIVRNANEWMKQFGPLGAGVLEERADKYVNVLVVYAVWWLGERVDAMFPSWSGASMKGVLRRIRRREDG